MRQLDDHKRIRGWLESIGAAQIKPTTTRGGHVRFEFSYRDRRYFHICPASTGDRRSFRNAISDLRHQLGLLNGNARQDSNIPLSTKETPEEPVMEPFNGLPLAAAMAEPKLPPPQPQPTTKSLPPAFVASYRGNGLKNTPRVLMYLPDIIVPGDGPVPVRISRHTNTSWVLHVLATPDDDCVLFSTSSKSRWAPSDYKVGLLPVKSHTITDTFPRAEAQMIEVDGEYYVDMDIPQPAAAPRDAAVVEEPAAGSAIGATPPMAHSSNEFHLQRAMQKMLWQLNWYEAHTPYRLRKIRKDNGEMEYVFRAPDLVACENPSD